MTNTPAPIPDGLNVDTYSQTGTGYVRQAVTVGDATNSYTQKINPGGDGLVSLTNPNTFGQIFATISAEGNLNVAPPGVVLLADTFDTGKMDTDAKWSTSGSVTPVVTAGLLSLPPLQATNAGVSVSSRPSFGFASAATLAFSVSMEAGTVSVGNHRFFGFGTPNANTAALPIYDGIGFEITTAGTLQAVVYNAGNLVFNQAITASTDGLPHRYVVITRGDITYFYKDAFDLPAAFTFAAPASQRLPIRLHSINATITNAISPVLTLTGVGMYDNSRNAVGLSDGANPWLKATVKDARVAPSASDTSLVVGINPVSKLPGLVLVDGELQVHEPTQLLILAELRRIALCLESISGVSISADALTEVF
jgi:hypothetical protein